MEIYNGTLCISGTELIISDDNPDGVMSKSNYDQMVLNGKDPSYKGSSKLKVLRRASYGTPSLIEFDSLPYKYKQEWIRLHDDPRRSPEVDPFLRSIKPDAAAYTFYSTYRLPDGRPLPADKVKEYSDAAAVLNALRDRITELTRKRRSLGHGTPSVWAMAAEWVFRAQGQWKHKLPENALRLRDKYKAYFDGGYIALVSNKFGNSNSRKVTAEMERLILSLYCRPEKPYVARVHLDYLQFLAGNIEVVDHKTGEIFNPVDFINDDGTPTTVSEGTIANIVNDPRNAPVVGKLRNDAMTYNNNHRPHHHRHSPVFALSKISMDDRDLPRKLPDGTRVKAYYAYDVASGAVIGAAYSRKKNRSLFVECMRDMLRNLDSMGFGLPLEVEVEHHIVNEFADDLMKAGVVFPFVRWCNPGNSQEKRAEHFNKEKKYGYEKRYQEGIGRWYARREANVTRSEKIFDENNDTYREKTYSYEQLVAEDRQVIELYNADCRKGFKVSRIDYLRANVNPGVLTQIDRPLLVRYIGERTDCSVVRNQYVKVQYGKYVLPSPATVDKLEPGDYSVQAYWMPADEIKEVYLYQSEAFICTATTLVEYNEATAEQTDDDRRTYTDQAKYLSEYDARVRHRAAELAKVVVFDKKKTTETLSHTSEEVIITDYVDVPLEMDAEYYRQLAKNNL